MTTSNIQTTATIKNISFILSDTIEFSFQHNDGQWDSAYLQLPDTGDSVHSISDEEYNYDDEQQTIIFNQLTNFYFDQFKDVECAAAAALLHKEVLHVEEVDGLYVAFSESDTDIIKESACRSYYNKKALFDVFQWDMENNPDENELIKKATKQYFGALTRVLIAKLEKELESAKNNASIDDLDIYNQGFDDTVHEFMKEEFNQFDIDYNDNDLAKEFYQMYACDCRVDAETELRECTED